MDQVPTPLIISLSFSLSLSLSLSQMISPPKCVSSVMSYSFQFIFYSNKHLDRIFPVEVAGTNLVCKCVLTIVNLKPASIYNGKRSTLNRFLGSFSGCCWWCWCLAMIEFAVQGPTLMITMRLNSDSKNPSKFDQMFLQLQMQKAGRKKKSKCYTYCLKQQVWDGMNNFL